jgi:hypothetical protein
MRDHTLTTTTPPRTAQQADSQALASTDTTAPQHSQRRTPPQGADQAAPRSRSPSIADAPRGQGSRDIALHRLSQTQPSRELDTVSQPEPAPAIDLARDLGTFERKLAAQKQRTLHLDEAAGVINELRFNPLAMGRGDGTAPRHSRLATAITDAHMARWNHALGLTPQQIDRMAATAKKGGYAIPTSGSLFQAVLYGAIPFGALKMTPVRTLAASLSALVAQPFVTAGLQTPIVAAINVMRQKNAPMVKLAGNIKARETQQDIIDGIRALEVQAQADARELSALLEELAARQPAPADPAQGTATPEQVQAFIEGLPRQDRQRLETLHERQSQRAVDVACLVLDALRLEGMQDRQYRSTRAQVLPRVLRALSGIFNPAMQGRLPAAGITAVSVVLAFGALAAQHYAAGVDEVTAQTDEHKLNLLYGDVFNDEGREDWNAGRPVRGSGIDADKLRALVAEPETMIAGRISTLTGKHRGELQSRLDRMEARTPTPDELERGRPGLDELRGQIAQCDADIQRIADGDLAGLGANGFARKLFDEVMKDTSVAFSWREGMAKLFSPLEYSAQLGQRVAQQFTWGVFGGAGAVGLTRGVGAIVGGVSKLAAGAQVALSLGSGVVALFSATAQYTAVNAKNARRDHSGDDEGLVRQVLHGVAGPIWQMRASAAGREAMREGTALAASEHAAADRAAAAIESNTNGT